ncbi:hypothetical protein RIF29_05536 [Crotalaria pallida]|uniref:Fe2OG dioxygenase domain-containing protein n=1 Tax=Crotalaria pallida TaxID=3830 RepID=A0AAN9J2W8_CROPI
MDCEPPFLEAYKTLLQSSSLGVGVGVRKDDIRNEKFSMVVEKSCDELPIIDLNLLNLGHFEREKCMKEITEAAKEWGFFQVVNHGVSQELLLNLKFEQMKVFQRPFATKSQEDFMNLPPNTYRWGNPSATNLSQIIWSETFFILLQDVARMDQQESIRSTMEAFASEVIALAESLVQILAEKLSINFSYFQENCSANTCFLRLNRYPPCPFPSNMFGLIPHSDSSFLTIVHQDHVGGLQLMKDGNWVDVKPIPRALIVNIGDLLQALSNGFYKSVQHRVVATENERYSVAYFYNPCPDAEIESHGTPPLYRKFTFGEYNEQKEKDVKKTGDKVGLSRFLLKKHE